MRNLFFKLTILLVSCNFVSKKTENLKTPLQPEKGTILIGDQLWMEKNLNTSVFQNGDTIPEIRSNKEWLKADSLHQPAWCYYENNPANDSVYGKMYNWYAVNDQRKIAPVGYHVASNEEWKKMIEFLGGNLIAGKKLKAKHGWEHDGNGTNESGLGIVPAGERHRDGEFSSAGLLTAFWTSTNYSPEYAWEYVMYHFYDQVKNSYVAKAGGFSVRCIKD